MLMLGVGRNMAKLFWWKICSQEMGGSFCLMVNDLQPHISLCRTPKPQLVGAAIGRKVPIRNPCKGPGWVFVPLTTHVSPSSWSLSTDGGQRCSARTGFLNSPFLQHLLVLVVMGQQQVQGCFETCTEGLWWQVADFQAVSYLPTSETLQEFFHWFTYKHLLSHYPEPGTMLSNLLYLLLSNLVPQRIWNRLKYNIIPNTICGKTEKYKVKKQSHPGQTRQSKNGYAEARSPAGERTWLWAPAKKTRKRDAFSSAGRKSEHANISYLVHLVRAPINMCLYTYVYVHIYIQSPPEFKNTVSSQKNTVPQRSPPVRTMILNPDYASDSPGSFQSQAQVLPPETDSASLAWGVSNF